MADMTITNTPIIDKIKRDFFILIIFDKITLNKTFYTFQPFTDTERNKICEVIIVKTDILLLEIDKLS